MRLSTSALALLESELQRAWVTKAPGKKLTRQLRADLFGVSPKTADQILGRNGVDRATLALAFTNLGLEWKDEYCEDSVCPVESGDPSPTAEQAAPRRRPLWAGAAIVIAAIAGGVWWHFRPSTPDTSQDWAVKFNVLFESANDKYHHARYDEAAAELQRAKEIAGEHQSAGLIATTLRLAGDLEAERGNLKLAAQDYTEALHLREMIGDKVSQPAIQEALGTVQIDLRLLPEAKQNLLLALEGFTKAGDAYGTAMAQRDLGKVCLAAQDLTEAESWLVSARTTIKGQGRHELEFDIQSSEAMIAKQQGHLDEARAKLSECLRYWTERHHQRWIARTQQQLGSVELASGRTEEARRVLGESLRSFRALGDAFSANQVELLLSSGSESAKK